MKKFSIRLDAVMPIPYQKLAVSNHPAAQTLRKVRRGVHRFTLPAPSFLIRPILWGFLALRSAYYFVLRVFIAEPMFKAYCKQYGRGVRTGIFIHWIQGKGDIVVGDDVIVDGKCSITFAVRFTAHPTLSIGDQTGIGHNCSFTIARQITIGKNCRIASDVFMFDSSGHPSNPEARRAGLTPTEEDIHPITIGDNVWIGRRAIICPGVTVGEGSIVSAGAVVMNDVPPYTVVAGNPARKIASLASTPPEPVEKPPASLETIPRRE